SSQAFGAMLPIYDVNGNVTRMFSVTDFDTPVAKYEYGPFGEVRGIDGTHSQAQRNPWRWSTKLTDPENGLVYYGYMYYTASLGRWINRDPIQDQGGLNIYRYVINSPASQYDALGLNPAFGWVAAWNVISATSTVWSWVQEVRGVLNEGPVLT